MSEPGNLSWEKIEWEREHQVRPPPPMGSKYHTICHLCQIVYMTDEPEPNCHVCGRTEWFKCEPT